MSAHLLEKDAVSAIHGSIPSLVMNEMNSDTHSCMHSLASFAILAFSGSANFMIRATGAKFCMLASDCCNCCFDALLDPGVAGDRLCCGGEEDDCGEEEGIAIRRPGRAKRRLQMAGCQRSL